jgi:hypothetical protein
MRKSIRIYFYAVGIFSIVPITLLWCELFQPARTRWLESWWHWLFVRLDALPCSLTWMCTGVKGSLLLDSFSIFIFYAMLFAPSWGILRVWEFEQLSARGKKVGRAFYFITAFLTALQVLLLAATTAFVVPWFLPWFQTR